MLKAKKSLLVLFIVAGSLLFFGSIQNALAKNTLFISMLSKIPEYKIVKDYGYNIVNPKISIFGTNKSFVETTNNSITKHAPKGANACLNLRISQIQAYNKNYRYAAYCEYVKLVSDHLGKIKSVTVNLNTTNIKYASYLLHVKNKIENVWKYPLRARRERISGQLVIEFSINKNGSIYRVKILRSSGRKTLDKAAIRAIYDVVRYNPFPQYWTIKRLNIIGTFTY